MPQLPSNIVLSVAGSDPSGGAGIQADLKTMAMVGVYGAAAITCLTVQNTLGVYANYPVEASLVRDQMERVLCDMPVSHIKTGMIGNAAVAKAIGALLKEFTGEVVCDPVLKATHGSALLEPADLDVFKKEIVSQATVLTPNLDELRILSGSSCRTRDELSAACARLFALFPRLRAVVSKGGHFEPHKTMLQDALYLRQDLDRGITEPSAWSHRQRIPSSNTHGTGCTLASAYASFHLLTGSDRQAFADSTMLIDQLIRNSSSARLGAGAGPLLHHLFDRET